VLRLLLIAAIGTALGFAVNEAIFWYRHVYEPNATIEADFTVMSSSVNGNIREIHVRPGTAVTAGTLLATMDAEVEKLDIESLKADVDRERALIAQIEAERSHFRIQIESKIETAKESIRQLKRLMSTLDERLSIASKNVERNNKLLYKSVVPRQQIDDANDKLLEVRTKQRELETEIRVSEKQLAELEAERQRESIYRSRIAVAERNIAKNTVLLDQTRQRLKDMNIYSPIDGVVNEVYVNIGAYVEDGDRVFLLHATDEIWIEANIDERDIRHVKPGQEVKIEIDAYPYEEFAGRVRTIGKVTLAMIENGPNTNKANRSTQKIPVVIDMPEITKPIWPGMRATVNIVIR
jgi:membrane fusion protein (multidrug efflux system)